MIVAILRGRTPADPKKAQHTVTGAGGMAGFPTGRVGASGAHGGAAVVERRSGFATMPFL
jgi:hypothetical protein